jgi:hypothetical protein
LIRELPREQLWLGQQFKATRETQADDTWQKSIINNRYSTQRDRGREALTHRGVTPMLTHALLTLWPVAPLVCRCCCRNVYYVGYHLPGACRAEGRKWTDTVNFDDAIMYDRHTHAVFI